MFSKIDKIQRVSVSFKNLFFIFDTKNFNL